MRINRTVAMLSIFALALFIGAGVWFALPDDKTSPAVSAAEIADAADGEIKSISASLAEGQIFYYKIENFQTERHGMLGPNQYPKNVILDTWLKVGSDGRISESVTTMSSMDGDLLQHAIGTDSTITQTDVASGSVLQFNLASDTTTLNEWLRESAARPQDLLQGDDYKFVRRDTLGGETSVVFEREIEAGSPMDGVQLPARKVRLEFVEDDPLVNRETRLVQDSTMTYAVSESASTLEYKVLPAGTDMPTFP